MPTRTRPPAIVTFRAARRTSTPHASDSRLQTNAAGSGCRARPAGWPPRIARRTSTPHASDSRCRPTPQARAAGRLPCFPLSKSRHFPPGPSPHLRPAPSQIRFVSLCRLFRRPPAGPSAPRLARAWQIRLVSLCPLVHRTSNPSCAAFPQARAAGKERAHHSAQLKPNPRRSPAAARCGCRACPAATSLYPFTPRIPYPTPMPTPTRSTAIVTSRAARRTSTPPASNSRPSPTSPS